MGCIFAIIALAVPRVLMFIIFMMTGWFGYAFETRMWSILGFVFMPYTTLAYLAAMLNNNHALTGGWLALFIAAMIVDVTHWGGGGHTYRKKSRSGRA
jgi:hypothetical protein